MNAVLILVFVSSTGHMTTAQIPQASMAACAAAARNVERHSENQERRVTFSAYCADAVRRL